MKRILQALDTASTQPVEGANDMARFLRVVSEKPAEVITEASNPHKVALPVQMAMNHYQAPKTQPVQQSASLLRKYFTEAEEEVIQEEADRKERLRMYSQKIAERVLVKEGLADLFTSKPKQPAIKDWNKRAKELFAQGMDEQQVRAQLLKEGCPLGQVDVYVQGGQLEETPIDMTGDPNDPVVHGHAKANPMSLKGRIQQARNQLRELANMAESDDLVVWQKICQLSKGGMFMGLEQNIEQVRHGIEQLAAKRKQGGIASRGIDKGIGETGVVDSLANKLVSAGTSARKAVDTAVNSIPRPFDEKEVANDLQKQKKQS